MNVTTNNVPRLLVDPAELTVGERAEFDYLDWPRIDAGVDSATFFRYRNQLHDLGNFTRVEPGGDLDAAGWSGFHADSIWTATVVRLLPDDPDRVVVGYAVS